MSSTIVGASCRGAGCLCCMSITSEQRTNREIYPSTKEPAVLSSVQHFMPLSTKSLTRGAAILRRSTVFCNFAARANSSRNQSRSFTREELTSLALFFIMSVSWQRTSLMLAALESSLDRVELLRKGFGSYGIVLIRLAEARRFLGSNCVIEPVLALERV